MQYLGSRVPLNIPHFRDFAATVKIYTHHNDVQGIFFCHNDNTDLCHFLGQAKWHVTWLPDYMYHIRSKTSDNALKWVISND